MVTTTGNFAFLQSSFIEAKTALNEEIRTGKVNFDRLKSVGLEGASRTGKTWDICVFLCHYVTTYSGKQVTVCRDHRAKLTKTFYQTLKKVWVERFKLPAHHFNKTCTDISYNGNTIRFIGVNDDIMTAHGIESDLLIVNEGMGVDKESINQLEQRTTEFFIIDYNPSDVESHLYDRELQPTYRLHKTTIFDNPYAPPNAKAKILSYAHPDSNDLHVAIKAGYTPEEWKALKERNVENKTAHKYNWEVYGLGMRAAGEDLIFNNWTTYTDEEEPNDNDLEWSHVGGDFGFKVDPTAAVKVKRVGNNLYLKRLIYETGLLNNEIAEKIKKLGEHNDLSIWDRAEEKSIFELRAADVQAWYSEKGPGSLSFGIQKMHQFNIFIHEDSHELIKEFRGYKWKKDRQGNYVRNSQGKRVPIDKNNHGIDATRYVLLYYYWSTVDAQNHESDL